MQPAVMETDPSYLDSPIRSGHKLSGRLTGLARLVVLLSLFVFPLCFGGVHAHILYPFSAFALLAAALVLSANRSAFSQLLIDRNSAPVSSKIFLYCFILLIYIMAQYLVLISKTVTHPVLGKTHILHDQQSFIEAFVLLCLFWGVFASTRLWLSVSIRAMGQARLFILISGVMLASIGIAHWFYDNGLLFWTFAPEYLHVSERARWPFVNPNHLGDVLLLSLFPAVSFLLIKWELFRSILRQQLSRKGSRFAEVLSRSKTQRLLIQAAFAALLVVVLSLCLTATLSRGAWTAAVAGLFFFYLMSQLKASYLSRRSASGENPASGQHIVRSMRVRRHSRDLFSALTRKLNLLQGYALPLLILAAFFFLLQGKGAELVEGRIEYGLLYSKNDMRWQLYLDTFNMIKEHLYLGVGLGNWESNYFSYMNPLLAGMNPKYLHSDPLQMIAELGIVGSLPFVFIAIFLAFQSIRCVWISKDHDKQLWVLGLFTGLLAFVLSSAVEFPFRIPAIAAFAAVSLALLCAELDASERETEHLRIPGRNAG